MYTNNRMKLLGVALAATSMIMSCSSDDTPASRVEIKDYSTNPALAKTLPGFEGIKINTLISSDDKLTDSPSFVFGGQPDGAALMKDPNSNGFILINNHEIMRSVSRVYLDETFKPVKGEYIVNGEGGLWRLCSATLATPEEHGFGPLFLTAGESGPESMIHTINPLGLADPANSTRTKPALGKANMENGVPLPKDAFPGKTVIVIGEDNSDGQAIVYISNTVGDLDNGLLYFLRRTNLDPVETNMTKGQVYDVELVPVYATNAEVKAAKGTEIAAKSVEKNAIQFARMEDVDYRKGGGAAGREIYFTATGVSSDRKNPVIGKTMWGRIYKFTMDATDLLKGKLEVVVDGADNPGNSIVNPDNICVTNNYVYIQEDGDSFYDDNKHDGRVWQYSIASKELKAMIEMDHRRTDATFNGKYNPLNETRLSSWEYGAMYDISNLVGIPNTFLLNLHPHTWRDMKYNNADGSTVTKSANITDPSTNGFTEGGQVLILSGVPR